MRFIFTLILISKLAASVAQGPYAIVPQPISVSLKPGIFELTEEVEIVAVEDCIQEARMFVDWLNLATNKLFKIVPGETWRYSKPFIFFNSQNKNKNTSTEKLDYVNPRYTKLLEATPDGSYNIQVDTRGITITAADNDGIFYATQTLRQMFPVAAEKSKLRLPYQFSCVSISDQPHFRHRGLLLDACRHFMSVDYVKKVIDLLAFYKMNVLHWHLTEDQGWRIQIDRYPKLTEVGAWRKEADGSIYGGFYTKAQIKDIVAYAAKRHITVIPEIELPGHSVAAIASYPFLSCTEERIEVENEWGVFKDIYCAGNESVFEFLENVLTEVCELFPSPFIHIGGDEAPKTRWEACPKCQKRMEDEKLKDEAQLQTYFIERIATFLKTKNKTIIGWDEILEGGIPADAIIQSWRGMEGGIHSAKMKHDVVMSPTSHCYFDYGLSSIDVEKVYSFDPIPAELNQDERLFIRGAECNLWSEHIPEKLADEKILPRMPALAEVLWAYEKDRQYSEFILRLRKHYEKWEAMGYKYGYETVPVTFFSKKKGTGLEVSLAPSPSDLQLYWSTDSLAVGTKYIEPIVINKPTTLYVKGTTSQSTKFPSVYSKSFTTHLALGQKISLGFTPSPYYTGGSDSALIDGVLGPLQFRDRAWQAVSGKDMNSVIDLGKSKNIQSVKSRFYHYSNAWIHRPEKMIVEVSEDSITWKKMGESISSVPMDQAGELIVEFTITHPAPLQARYVRVTALSSGPNPAWHPAPGEPSWLFCDEIEIR